MLSFLNSLEMVIICQILSKCLGWLRRSDFSAFVLSFTINFKMSTRISLAYENSIYTEMCVVMMPPVTGFQLCIFFNKEIILAEFVFYLFIFLKGSIISRALKLHNPSHNRLSHQEPHRLEKETQYCTPMQGALAKARGWGSESRSVSLKLRIR